MSLNGPLLAALRESIADAGAAAKEGDGTNVVFNLLDAFAALGRHVAQVSWTLRHDDPDCDDLMAEDENDLVFTVIKMPIVSMVYPEFRLRSKMCSATHSRTSISGSKIRWVGKR